MARVDKHTANSGHCENKQPIDRNPARHQLSREIRGGREDFWRREQCERSQHLLTPKNALPGPTMHQEWTLIMWLMQTARLSCCSTRVDLGSEYQIECVLRGGGCPKHLVSRPSRLNSRGVPAIELPVAGFHVGTIGPQAPYNREKSNATVEFGNLPKQSH